MNEPHCHKNNRHRFGKTNWELTENMILGNICFNVQHRQNVTYATKN